MKVLSILLLVFLSLYAEKVRILASGEYTLKNLNIPKDQREAFAKSQALIIAKQRALEKAGTAIYSSINISSKNGKEDVVSKIEAISAGIVQADIISESYDNNTYYVKIETIIESADIENVLNKADERLVKITKLQKENAKISKQLNKLTHKMYSLLNPNSNYTIEKPIKLFEEQEELIKNYEKNIRSMKVEFKKGTLAELARNNRNEKDTFEEEIKRDWDLLFTKKYLNNFKYKISDVYPVKNGKYADIEFDLVVGLEKPIKLYFSTLLSNTTYNKKYGTALEYDKLYFNNYRRSLAIFRWIKKYRNFAICVSLGDMEYLGERVIRTIDTHDYSKYKVRGSVVSQINTLMGNRSKERVEYLNGLYYSKRIIRDVPIELLENIEYIKVELREVSDEYFNPHSEQYLTTSERKYKRLEKAGEFRY